MKRADQFNMVAETELVNWLYPRKGIAASGQDRGVTRKAGRVARYHSDALNAGMDQLLALRRRAASWWIDDDGESHEQIFDVAWASNRSVGADGKLPPIANTVDMSTGFYDNATGAAQFTTVW